MDAVDWGRIMDNSLIEFAERMGIKKNTNGLWVHPLCGVIHNAETCETDSEIVCCLLDSYTAYIERERATKELIRRKLAMSGQMCLQCNAYTRNMTDERIMQIAESITFKGGYVIEKHNGHRYLKLKEWEKYR